MNGNRIFVDTNILLYLLNGDKEVTEMISNKDVVISFITELELLSYSNLNDDSEQLIKELLNECIIRDISGEIKELTIEFRRKSKLKLPDSIIAATAYFNKLPLLTADKQFRTVDELDVIIYDV
ncbi:type II toxin-antitoxin system VapC family toxin [Marinigracilibium pacificum]|uniref:Type II toxin-antitoxin system VapC family toxin n=1 Tax=Marinigracilibium pacificum TaxID=2729599 RepID=A0A848J5L6_9BACT|nr:type II toxin-antitoxin system VapC family toxin [Marinigracilibium pacificum]NMM50765.1 type II toxin-antitoxin system VapC family toxin [Marinigracilibium pacificum]